MLSTFADQSPSNPYRRHVPLHPHSVFLTDSAKRFASLVYRHGFDITVTPYEADVSYKLN